MIFRLTQQQKELRKAIKGLKEMHARGLVPIIIIGVPWSIVGPDGTTNGILNGVSTWTGIELDQRHAVLLRAAADSIDKSSREYDIEIR